MCLSPRRRPVAPAHHHPRHASLSPCCRPPASSRGKQHRSGGCEGALGLQGTVSSLLFAPSAQAARFHEALCCHEAFYSGGKAGVRLPPAQP